MTSCEHTYKQGNFMTQDNVQGNDNYLVLTWRKCSESSKTFHVDFCWYALLTCPWKFFLSSARNVLALPYIKQNLTKFITEKELLIQMKNLNAKDSPAIDKYPIKSPLTDTLQRTRPLQSNTPLFQSKPTPTPKIIEWVKFWMLCHRSSMLFYHRFNFLNA